MAKKVYDFSSKGVSHTLATKEEISVWLPKQSNLIRFGIAAAAAYYNELPIYIGKEYTNSNGEKFRTLYATQADLNKAWTIISTE